MVGWFKMSKICWLFLSKILSPSTVGFIIVGFRREVEFWVNKNILFVQKKQFFCSKKNLFWIKNNFFSGPKSNLPRKLLYEKNVNERKTLFVTECSIYRRSHIIKNAKWTRDITWNIFSINFHKWLLFEEEISWTSLLRSDTVKFHCSLFSGLSIPRRFSHNWKSA